jgi:long-chain fatty acid transport protein
MLRWTSALASSRRSVIIVASAGACLASLLAATSARATDGYLQDGIGAREKALAGAGVASSTDATAASLNPAGLTNVPSQVNVSASALFLSGGYTATGGGGTPFDADGRHDNKPGVDIIPNLAATWRVNWGVIDAVALTAYGNGGVASHYKNIANPDCAMVGGGTGVFCGGPLGIRLAQDFYSVAFAKEVMPGISIGVAPILARQLGKVDGVGPFAGLSVDPTHFTSQGTDESWGAGVRAGIEWTVKPGLRLGVAGNTMMHMSNFDKYRGLLANQGDFDVPATVQAGIAVDVRPNLTFLADYKRIWYSSVASVGDPTTTPALFGASNGPGFGVQDVNMVKVGLEWHQSPKLTLRAGYSYNSEPITSRDVDLNIMTLGVVQHHITGGLKYDVTQNLGLELAAMYAPRASVTGTELGNPSRTVEIDNSEFEITLGAVYRFGGPTIVPQPLK